MYPYKNRKDIQDATIKQDNYVADSLQEQVVIENYHNNNPETRYIPPNVIENYIGEVINTYIPGYGRQNVYVRGISRDGMVSLVVLRNKPHDCVAVHYSDLSGVSKPQFKC